MYLTEEDAELFNESIGIMSRTYKQIREIPIGEALKDLTELSETDQKKYARKDGKDTKFFDIVAEDVISLGGSHSEGHLNLFNRVLEKCGVIITEERGRVPRETRIEHDTPVIISDPIDISVFIEDAVRGLKKTESKKTMGYMFDRKMEELGPGKLRRHASSTSFTLLRDNTIKYTTILNLFTGDLYIGSPNGVFKGNISDARCTSDVSQKIDFIDDESLCMVCYNIKGKYEQNRVGTHLRFFPLHEDSKYGLVGPLRFTYLVRFDDEDDPGAGIAAYNGEKIQEMLPSIAMALFSKGKLQAYKLFCDSEYVQERAGRMMTPNIANSLFSNGGIANAGVDLRFLNNYDYPSQFRDTAIIVSGENDAALTMMDGMVKRNYAIRIV